MKIRKLIKALNIRKEKTIKSYKKDFQRWFYSVNRNLLEIDIDLLTENCMVDLEFYYEKKKEIREKYKKLKNDNI